MSLDHAFFYKSINGDRVYDDTSFEHWLKKFFTSGVFLNDLQVSANDDMTVTVGGGYVNIDGKVKVFTSESSLIIETAGASYPRIDSIVLERNDSERDIILKVVKGGYSSEPVAHTPVRQDGVYQLVIAQVLVNAGAVKVTQANITDTRSNTELCGIVAGAVDQIDFSQVQAQFDSYLVQYKKQLEEEHAEHNADMDAYLEQMEAKTDQMEADFAAWFENIRNQLDEDAAGHLQNQIDEINEKLEYAGGSMVFVNVEADEYNVEGLEVNLEIDGRTYTEKIFENSVVFTGVLEVGKAVITCVDEAQEINTSTSIDIPYYGAYEKSIKLSSGGSYKAWIEAGGLNPSSYETLDALLEDEKAVRTLMTKKDSVDVLAQMSGDDLATIINHYHAAKWVNYREYAYSTLSANADIKALMDASGMYGMYITMKEPEALVPTMTSNTTPDGIAFASSESSGYEAYKVFDNNNGSFWWNNADDSNGKTVGYKFTKSVIVTKIEMMSNSTDGVKTFKVQGANNESDWVDLSGELSISSDVTKTTSFTLNNRNPYLYYRIYVLSVYGTVTCANMRTLQFYGYQEGATLWQPKGLVPVMTSNTAPYGEAFTSTFTTNYEGYKAFDNNVETNWGSTHEGRANAYIGYKFNTPTNVTEAWIIAQHSDMKDACRLKEFVIEASNDGTNYTPIYSDTYATTSSNTIGNTYTFDNPNYYLYYRVRQVGDNYSAAYSTAIRTIQFYGRQLEALIPPMTSNTTPIGEASASDSGDSTWKVFDGDNSTYWISTKHTGNQWVQYAFDKPTVANALKLSSNTANNAPSFVKLFDLLGSNDGDSFDVIYSGENTTYGLGTVIYHTFNNTKAYKYYRLVSKGNFASVTAYDQIGELQLYGTPDYEARTYIYDNGVEVLPINVVNSNTNAIAEKKNDYLYVGKNATASTRAGVYTTNEIDLTEYKLIRILADKEWNTANNGAFFIGAYETNPPTDSNFNKVSYQDIHGQSLPDIELSISNVNASYYVGLMAATVNASYAGYFSVNEWWLE